jgi:nucleotide-binding universal stress UspA family protein
MNQTSSASKTATPMIQRVLHPTDFSEGSQIAFYHALKAALQAKSELSLLHVSPEGNSQWSSFPGVRETLVRWGLLPPGSPKSAVVELGIGARKVVTREPDPVEAVLTFLRKHPSDMIGLATHQHKGHVRWMSKSVAEPVARRAAQMTLFIPGQSKGFVSEEDGNVSLKSVLIPVADNPRPDAALKAAARLVNKLRCPSGIFTLLHVSQTDSMPAFRCPEVKGWEWKKERRTGDVIKTILDTAEQTDADLIVMATDGRNGFLDALRGSHSERVLRQCGAPLLTVPVDSFVANYFS